MIPSGNLGGTVSPGYSTELGHLDPPKLTSVRQFYMEAQPFEKTVDHWLGLANLVVMPLM